MYRKRWIAVFLLLFSALSWATKPLPGWKALEPSDIEALFKDKTLGDGFHYSYRFLSDGSLSGVEMATHMHIPMVSTISISTTLGWI